MLLGCRWGHALVVVPHRAQRADMQTAFPELRVLDPETGSVLLSAVDTVERFQGGERTAVIYSATESDRDYLLAAGKFLYDPNRLTVFIALVLTSFLARFGYQMGRSPVLPRFAQDLGAAPEVLGLIVAASTITGVVIKLPAGALSDVLGRKRMMLLGCLFFAVPCSVSVAVSSRSA